MRPCTIRRTMRVEPANVFSDMLGWRVVEEFFRAMDIREIARRAKVSTATVSRTINGVPTVDPQLAKRVWKVVNELGYYPNKQARALVSGRSRIFGLIVSEITNPFFPEIVQSFEDLAVQHNYEILLTSTVYDPKRMELSVRRMIERRVDGVAILTFGMEDSLIEDLRFRNVPLVFVDVGPRMPSVRQRPTGVLCSNDMTAIGLMREAFDYGIRVPEDLSVVGFDDIRLAQFMIPPLTTVQMSQTELASLAFKALLNHVESDSSSLNHTESVLHTTLVVRKSTGLAPSSVVAEKSIRSRRLVSKTAKLSETSSG